MVVMFMLEFLILLQWQQPNPKKWQQPVTRPSATLANVAQEHSQLLKGCIGVKFLQLTVFLSYISECCTGPGPTENLAQSLHSDGG